jgi:hypothetical protein
VCDCAQALDPAKRTIPAHREAYARVPKQTVLSGRIGDVYVAIEKWIEDQVWSVMTS